MPDTIQSELAPTGALRAGINLSNPLLVTGKTAAGDRTGDPEGVSPDMARAIADKLGIGVTYVTFPSPGELADAAEADAWDIGLIAAEAKRAETIAFTPAYVEIEATYLVPAGSSIATIDEVDRPGVRIAVSGRSAYDLYLVRTLKHAELVRGAGLDGTVDLFEAEKLDVLAGLKPGLMENVEKLPGARILDGRFTVVQQAIGTQKHKTQAAAFLRDFVEEAKASGLVAELIDKHGVTGRLLVAG
ncbi:MAG TPA: transporter substrate-binding domain-containing protein [Alphaproteobacteria bacterium]|nr:transporter substrate-binding domain-containing protein [Alphaproteobacteria bacterium]